MFVQNGVHMDNRVLKEARVLRDAGWQVTIVGKQTDPSFLPFEDFEGIRIFRVSRGARGLRQNVNRGFESGKRWLLDRLLVLRPEPTMRGPRRYAQAAAYRGSRLAVYLPVLKVWGAGYRQIMRLLTESEPSTYLYDWDRAVAEIEPQITADVWHAHDIDTMVTADRLRRKYGGKLIYDAHEYWLDCNNVYTPVEKAAWSVLEALYVHAADAVVTVSASISEVLAKRYRIAPPALVLNTPDYRAVARNRSLRDRFAIADDRYVVIYVGLITHQRGYEQLIDALPLIRDGVLVFMGPGNAQYVDALKKQAQAKGVSDRVVFAGAVKPDEIQTFTAGADVGVVVGQRGSISYECALPSKYFEYVFAGLPVATSAFVEMERLSKAYGLGETFDERDPASIAAALERIRQHASSYQGPDWDARRLALAEKYAWNSHKNDLLKIYDSLVPQEAHAKV